MQISMDDAVTQFIRDKFGPASLTTGWVLVVSTADGAGSGKPNGFIVVNNEDLPQHAKLGLLQCAANDINNELLLTFLGRMDGKDRPPF